MSNEVRQIKVGRQIQLPISKAIEISYKSIKQKFWRSMITAGGIFLGIAFLVSVLVTSLIDQHVAGVVVDKAAQAAAQNRQTWLVIMSLMVCTVGITNSMLMSVTERFKEIGTMKCLGALDIFIVELFLLESGFLGLIASFLGWTVSFLTVFLIGWSSHGWGVVSSIGFLPVLRTLGLAMGVGSFLTILATIPPAIRAAQMPPAMAMRTEV